MDESLIIAAVKVNRHWGMKRVLVATNLSTCILWSWQRSRKKTNHVNSLILCTYGIMPVRDCSDVFSVRSISTFVLLPSASSLTGWWK